MLSGNGDASMLTYPLAVVRLHLGLRHKVFGSIFWYLYTHPASGVGESATLISAVKQVLERSADHCSRPIDGQDVHWDPLLESTLQNPLAASPEKYPPT